MDLRKEILSRHSKAQTLRITRWIGNDPEKFAELAALFLTRETLLAQRAGWIISYCVEEYPHLVIPFIQSFLEYTINPPHNAVKRNVFRMLTMIELPEDIEGLAWDIAYSCAQQTREEIAVRVHAMTLITQIAIKYPELRQEAREILTPLTQHDSAGLSSRSRRLLKELNSAESSKQR